MATGSGQRRSWGSGSLLEETQRTGRVVWIGQVRVAGKQRQKTLGPKTGKDALTKRQAEAALRAFRDEAEAQALREAVTPAQTSTLTISQVGDRYLDHLEGFYKRKRATIVDYKIMLRLHLVPYFEDAPIREIVKAQVEQYVIDKQKTLKTATVIGHVVFLHGLLKYAVEEGWVERNVAADARRPQQPSTNKDIRYLTVEEVEAVIRAVPGDYFSATDRALYRVAAMTGLRQGELIALRWQDVDWTASRVRVRKSYTRGELGDCKSRAARRSVPMTFEVASALEQHFQQSEYQADDDKVFCHPQTGHYYDASKLLKRFKDALKAAGVRDVRFHDLRHTFGTHCASTGTPMRMLQSWMGHEDIQTTMIYADFAPDQAQEAAYISRAFAKDDGQITDRPCAA